MEPSAFLHHDNIRVLGDANTGALVFPAALRRPRRAPLRRGPAAPLSQSVRARRWRTSRYWTRCVWTVVTWWRTAFCDARSTGAEKRAVRTWALERDVKMTQRLLSISLPPVSDRRTKTTLQRAPTAWYARHTPLDTAPCWTGGAMTMRRTTNPVCQSHRHETDRMIVFELFSTGHLKQQYKQEGMNSGGATFVNHAVHS